MIFSTANSTQIVPAPLESTSPRGRTFLAPRTMTDEQISDPGSSGLRRVNASKILLEMVPGTNSCGGNKLLVHCVFVLNFLHRLGEDKRPVQDSTPGVSDFSHSASLSSPPRVLHGT